MARMLYLGPEDICHLRRSSNKWSGAMTLERDERTDRVDRVWVRLASGEQ